MSLCNFNDILVPARKEGRSIGAFEVWDTASIRAVIEAASELRQPVILQLGPIEIDYAGLEAIAEIAKYYAVRADIPVALHLDHGESFKRAIECIHAGFTSVMLDLSSLSFEENVRQTAELTKIAHLCGVTVEGELGRIGGQEAGGYLNVEDKDLTDPDQAVEYVRRTGIDALAVAIGTVHGVYRSKPNIRIELLKKIAAKVKQPLVLHGGSGTPEDIVRQAIAAGIAKVNICTEFVTAFSDTFVSERNDADFRMSVPGVFAKPRAAAAEVVKQKIKLFAGL